MKYQLDAGLALPPPPGKGDAIRRHQSAVQRVAHDKRQGSAGKVDNNSKATFKQSKPPQAVTSLRAAGSQPPEPQAASPKEAASQLLKLAAAKLGAAEADVYAMEAAAARALTNRT